MMESATKVWPPLTMKKPTNIVAPKKIHITIEVAFSVAIAASLTFTQLSRRLSAQTMSAPKVPMPAASTGVAMPKKMTPRTRRMRKIGAMVLRSRRNFSLKLTRSSGGSDGPSAGLM